MSPLTAAEFAASLQRLGPFEPAPTLAVAVSGGADSMALALFAADWVRVRGGQVVGLIVDHGLRPESAAEAGLARTRLARQGIEAELLTLHGLAPGPGLAARARTARYAALIGRCRARGLVHLLLGHHARDQAETVLMREAAGSAVAGLAGMAARRELDFVRILRPFLLVHPDRLRLSLRARGVAWIEDPSNHDLRTTRARVRAGLSGSAQDGAAALDRALARAADAGERRREDEIAAIAALARQVRLHPEGFAVLAPGPLPPAALAALVQTIGGAAYPPSPGRVAPLAAAPRPATLGGVRLLAAGRLGAGLLAVREAAAMAPPINAAGDACWDGRFRLWHGAPAAPGVRLGAVGPAAAGLRHCSDLPAVVLQTLPALWHQSRLVAVPHLGYPDPSVCRTFALVPACPRPAGGGVWGGA